MFSFEFCKFFKNTFFTEHLQAIAWEYLYESEIISINVEEVLRTVSLSNNKVCINGIPRYWPIWCNYCWYMFLMIFFSILSVLGGQHVFYAEKYPP